MPRCLASASNLIRHTYSSGKVRAVAGMSRMLLATMGRSYRWEHIRVEPDEKCPVNLGFVAPRRPLPSWSLREEGADAPDIMPNKRTQQRLRPWFIRPGRMLSLLAMAVCCRVAWCGEPSRNEPAPDGDRLVCGLGLTVWVSKPSEELRLAAASLGLPVDWRTSAGDRLSSAALARRDVAHHVPPRSPPRKRLWRRLRGGS